MENIELGYIKITNFRSSKSTMKGVKTQLAEKSICNIYVSNERLLSRIYKELLGSNE